MPVEWVGSYCIKRAECLGEMFHSYVWPTAGVAIKHGGVRQVAHVEARLGTSCAKPSSIWFFNLIVVSPRWHRRGHGHTGVGRTSILRVKRSSKPGEDDGDGGQDKVILAFGKINLLASLDHHLNLDRVGYFAWMGKVVGVGNILETPLYISCPFLHLQQSCLSDDHS